MIPITFAESFHVFAGEIIADYHLLLFPFDRDNHLE